MKNLPIILVTKEEIFFPNIRKRILLEKSSSKSSIEYALENDGKVVFLFEKERVGKTEADFYKYAVVADIIKNKIVEDERGREVYKTDFYTRERVMVPHVSQLKNENIFVLNDYIPYIEKNKSVKEENIFNLSELVKKEMSNILKHLDKFSFNDEFLTTQSIATIEEIDVYIYEILSGLNIGNESKYEYLKELNLERRLVMLLEYLRDRMTFIHEIDVIDNRIEKKNHQEEQVFYLKDKIESYQKELNEITGESVDPVIYYEKEIENLNIDADSKKIIHKEMNKIRNTSILDQDKARIIEYLDTVIDMPFSVASEVEKDLNKVEEELNKNHFGAEKVKNSILENLSMYNYSKEKNMPIMCLYGPPGVGKTSFGLSIAKANKRKMVRVSLGGIENESEIRGHRRTYVGAKMGRILSAIKESGVNNPLILLDEIDKINPSDGNSVAAALLEVLDPGQNKNFRDHYLEIGFDLSNVMFVATANSLNMPEPLIDRMDIISLNGYTEKEKLYIVKNHTIPKIFDDLTLKGFVISDEAILKIINEYTQESGVRNLERVIYSFIAKAIKNDVAEVNGEAAFIKEIYGINDVESLLGKAIYKVSKINEESEIGKVNGLAWSQTGGAVLKIEAVKTYGVGKMALTGQLGDVMKESAQAALTIIKSQHSEIIDILKESDIHVHLPEGGIPKDGPSAGIALTVSMISALKNKKVRGDVAMTGEVTLSGDVLPVGGVKEKVLAAVRQGIKVVLIPKENENDIEDIMDEIKEKIEVIGVEKVSEAVSISIM